MSAILQPIQVYLDSSDYSRFTQEVEVPGDQRLASVLAHLKRLISESKIVIRYSALHISEATHLVPSAKPQSMARARMIVRLSGLHCLRFLYELPVYDIFHSILATRKKEGMLPFPDYAFNDEGKWYPDLTSVVLDLRKSFKQTLSTGLKGTGLSRGNRILFEKTYIKDGRMSQHLLKYLPPDLALFDPTQFPVTDRFYVEKYPLKFLFGELGANLFFEELARGAFDPVNFISIYYEQYDKKRQTANWLRKLGGQLVSDILQNRVQMGFLREMFACTKQKDRLLRQEMISRFSELVPKLKIKHLKAFVKEWDKDFDRFTISKQKALNIVASSPDISPSFSIAVDAYKQYWIDNLDKFENAPTPEKSAIGDIYHTMYLPYVDVFRTDRRFSDILRKMKLPWKTRIVSTLMDLPEVIEEVIRERQNSD